MRTVMLPLASAISAWPAKAFSSTSGRVALGSNPPFRVPVRFRPSRCAAAHSALAGLFAAPPSARRFLPALHAAVDADVARVAQASKVNAAEFEHDLLAVVFLVIRALDERAQHADVHDQGVAVGNLSNDTPSRVNTQGKRTAVARPAVCERTG